MREMKRHVLVTLEFKFILIFNINRLLYILVGGACGVTLVVAFGFFVPEFWEVAGAYEWYFFILWMQVE